MVKLYLKDNLNFLTNIFDKRSKFILKIIKIIFKNRMKYIYFFTKTISNGFLNNFGL